MDVCRYMMDCTARKYGKKGFKLLDGTIASIESIEPHVRVIYQELAYNNLTSQQITHISSIVSTQLWLDNIHKRTLDSLQGDFDQ